MGGNGEWWRFCPRVRDEVERGKTREEVGEKAQLEGRGSKHWEGASGVPVNGGRGQGKSADKEKQPPKREGGT